MNIVMENKESTSKRCCPSCGSATKEEEITETCNLLADNTDILSVCIKKRDFAAYQEAVTGADELGHEDVGIEDPCMYCPHNVVIKDSSTFVRMEGSVGAFIEIHKCGCGTEFQVTA